MARDDSFGEARLRAPYSGSQGSQLASLVRRTIEVLEETTFELNLPGAQELRARRKALLTQLRTRILPHLESSDLPAVVVLAGSTGAGKSTVMNSLVGKEVSESSIIRPTTRTPVVLVDDADADMLTGHALSSIGRMVRDEGAISGIALVDAPDLDSVETDNRDISNQLLDAADLWIFVTTSQRYGDAVAWDTLREAHDRGLTCAVVLNRIPDSKRGAISRDLQKRLINLGMENTPLFVIRDEGPGTQILSHESMAEFERWLKMIADTRMGDRLVRRTTQAVLPKLREDLALLADGIEAQSHALIDLKDKAIEGAQPPREKLIGNILSGRFGAGSPTTVWLSMASGGGPLEALVSGKKSLLFNRRRRSERDAAATTIFDAVFTSARVALTQAGLAALGNITTAWKDDVVDVQDLLARASEMMDIDGAVAAAMDAWKIDVGRLGKEGKSNEFLGDAGNAALIGVAAAGITGALKACQKLGLEPQVRQARQMLVEHANDMLDSIVALFAKVADSVRIGEPGILRLRSSEFAEQMRYISAEGQ